MFFKLKKTSINYINKSDHLWQNLEINKDNWDINNINGLLIAILDKQLISVALCNSILIYYIIDEHLPENSWQKSRAMFYWKAKRKLISFGKIVIMSYLMPSPRLNSLTKRITRKRRRKVHNRCRSHWSARWLVLWADGRWSRLKLTDNKTQIVAQDLTYSQMLVDYIYKRSQNDEKVKAIPWIAEIVLLIKN